VLGPADVEVPRSVEPVLLALGVPDVTALMSSVAVLSAEGVLVVAAPKFPIPVFPLPLPDAKAPISTE